MQQNNEVVNTIYSAKARFETSDRSYPIKPKNLAK